MRPGSEPWSLLVKLHQALTLPRSPSVLLVCWRWRYEIALVVGGPLLVYGLVAALGPDWTQVVLLVNTTMLVMWPPARRRVVAQFWCMLTQHRLRTGFARTWLHTRDGRLPVILWCTPTEHGEKVTLWCPAGLTVADVTAHAEQLAAACYAIRIEAQVHPTHSHLIYLKVVRR